MGKAAETLPAIIRSIVGAILGFLGKAVGFVAENTWTLTVFLAGLIGVWLMQGLKRIRSLPVLNEVDISFFMIPI